MKLRPLTVDDLAAALALEGPPHAWSEGQLREELSQPPGAGLALGAVDAAGLAGHAYFRAQLDEWWLLQLRVDPRARRRGIGRALLEAGLAAAPEACREAWLEVAEDNAGAIALYAALGFVERGRRPRYYPDGRAAALMARPLASEP